MGFLKGQTPGTGNLAFVAQGATACPSSFAILIGGEAKTRAKGKVQKARQKGDRPGLPLRKLAPMDAAGGR
jgi:hypothetical protein